MASFGVLKLVSMMLMVCLVVMSSGRPQVAKAAVTCGDVVNHLLPCVGYVSNTGPLTASCCNGMKGLYAEAHTTADRQNVCKCIESAVKGRSYTGFNIGLASGLPEKCGLHIPYKISPDTDCNKVQ